MDLLLIAADAARRRSYRERCASIARRLRLLLGRPVDVVVMDAEDLPNQAMSSLVSNVVSDGRAAVRSSDCICVGELGYHSAGASHAAAFDVLGQVPDAESLTDALCGALSLRSLYNYQHRPAEESSVEDVINNAKTLLDAAVERVAAVDASAEGEAAEPADSRE